MRRKGTAEQLKRARMIVANMFDQGLRPAQVAAALEVGAQTVRRWRRQYAAGGRASLRSSRHPGRRPRLGEAERARLAGLLLRARPRSAASRSGTCGPSS